MCLFTEFKKSKLKTSYEYFFVIKDRNEKIFHAQNQRQNYNISINIVKPAYF